LFNIGVDEASSHEQFFMTPCQGMMVVTFMDGQLFAETAENDAKHRPVITSSPTEARETDSKWKVAGFVTRMTPRHHPSNIHSSRFARERERETESLLSGKPSIILWGYHTICIHNEIIKGYASDYPP
jgi:hypothetical protein